MNDESNRWGLAAAGVSLLGLAGPTLGASRSGAGSSHKERQADVTQQREPIWPIPLGQLLGIHDSVTAHRKGSGRPHKGVDLLAAAGTHVLSASAGRVLRVARGDVRGDVHLRGSFEPGDETGVLRHVVTGPAEGGGPFQQHARGGRVTH